MTVRPVLTVGGREIPEGMPGVVSGFRSDEYVLVEWETGQTCVHVSALKPVHFGVYPAGHGS